MKSLHFPRKCRSFHGPESISFAIGGSHSDVTGANANTAQEFCEIPGPPFPTEMPVLPWTGIHLFRDWRVTSFSDVTGANANTAQEFCEIPGPPFPTEMPVLPWTGIHLFRDWRVTSFSDVTGANANTAQEFCEIPVPPFPTEMPVLPWTGNPWASISHGNAGPFVGRILQVSRFSSIASTGLG